MWVKTPPSCAFELKKLLTVPSVLRRKWVRAEVCCYYSLSSQQTGWCCMLAESCPCSARWVKGILLYWLQKLLTRTPEYLGQSVGQVGPYALQRSPLSVPRGFGEICSHHKVRGALTCKQAGQDFRGPCNQNPLCDTYPSQRATQRAEGSKQITESWY